jgi:aspartate kinase
MIIEKFGGTSMADPQLVLERVNEQEFPSTIAVVSAPGIDQENPIKLTDLLLDYKLQPTQNRKDAVLRRVGNFVVKTGSFDEAEYMSQIDKEIDTFTAHNWPVEALGELWSAQIFSLLSRREFLNPLDVVQFNENGTLDVAKSCSAFEEHIDPGKQYVMPGFFGSLPNKNINVFERGGSDISGALAAVALKADHYRNWSDVAGFMSADPRQASSSARLLPSITYREAHELAINGCELLHRDVATLLEGAHIPTIMCETKTGRQGTIVSTERSWETKPIVSITGKILESSDIGALHIVGEGIAECEIVRSETLDAVLLALANAGVEVRHVGNYLQNAGITIHVPSIHFGVSHDVMHKSIVI